jgi:5-methylcytosine-specific restriction endonuclease McrA
VYDRICRECGQSFRTNQPAQVFCVRRCGSRFRNRQAWQRRKLRDAKPARCRQCNKEFTAWSKDDPAYCSRVCYQQSQTPASCPIPWKTCRCGAVYVNHRRAHCPPPPPAPRIMALCGYCDGVMEAYPYQRYCSRACRRRFDKDRRRALVRGAFVETVDRAKVYERDGWRCQVCGDCVPQDADVPHPLAATVDHVVPLAGGGEHSYANVQLAHFICNSRKSDGLEMPIAA